MAKRHLVEINCQIWLRFGLERVESTFKHVLAFYEVYETVTYEFKLLEHIIRAYDINFIGIQTKDPYAVKLSALRMTA